MDITDAIRTRSSVRNFNGCPLTADQIRELNECIARAESPFGGNATIRLQHFDLKGPFKPGTYGVITGATHFMLMAIGNGKPSLLTAGYLMEQAVLKATMLGLGTCWIAATFKGTDFDRGQTWPHGQRLRIVSPVGIPADRPSLLARITRMAARSAKRKPFGTLFFNGSFTQPLDESHTGIASSLALMRMAPSSTNSQPWRALVCGDTVHFFYRSKGDLSIIDCGIGLLHFHIGQQRQNAAGHFFEANEIPAHPGSLTYLISYNLSRCQTNMTNKSD